MILAATAEKMEPIGPGDGKSGFLLDPMITGFFEGSDSA
jgi:hypothetical protein